MEGLLPLELEQTETSPNKKGRWDPGPTNMMAINVDVADLLQRYSGLIRDKAALMTMLMDARQLRRVLGQRAQI